MHLFYKYGTSDCQTPGSDRSETVLSAEGADLRRERDSGKWQGGPEEGSQVGGEGEAAAPSGRLPKEGARASQGEERPGPTVLGPGASQEESTPQADVA